MTTIAYDGKALCVDSQSSYDTLLMSRSCQKMWLNVGDFQCVAVAGNVSHYPPLIAWLREGANPEKWADWGAIAWAVNQQGAVLRYVCGYPETVNAFDADGSGMELALGAMIMGASAFEAVLAASKFDLHTGGMVNEYVIQKSPLTAVK